MVGTYLVAFAAMLIAGTSALVLIYTVEHFDPADIEKIEEIKAPDLLDKIAV